MIYKNQRPWLALIFLGAALLLNSRECVCDYGVRKSGRAKAAPDLHLDFVSGKTISEAVPLNDCQNPGSRSAPPDQFSHVGKLAIIKEK